jgi:hypothetical protein
MHQHVFVSLLNATYMNLCTVYQYNEDGREKISQHNDVNDLKAYVKYINANNPGWHEIEVSEEPLYILGEEEGNLLRRIVNPDNKYIIIAERWE